MDDLISRQAAIDSLGDEPEVWSGKDEYEQGLNNQWHYDVNALKAVPSAERHGSWEHSWGDEWFCSACGHVITTEGSWEQPWQKYCEECGTKMDKGEETFNAAQHTECVVNLYTETKLRFVLDECIEDEELIEKILKALDEVEE